MLRWLRARRRRKRLAGPFPAAWETILARNVVHDRWLDPAAKRRLRDLVRLFVAEKRWEGCGGLALDDEIRVTIAARACLLLLGRPAAEDAYRRVRTILVYPSTVVPPLRRLRPFEVATGPVEAPKPILGEAWPRGPVILVWDAVRRTGRHPERGHDVVFHEFAHQLDLLDGGADGTPPLASAAERRRWAEVCSRAFLALRARRARGEPGLLDDYGATNEAEFFAVATEIFFDRPVELRGEDRDLYDVLAAYYGQDPATRVERGRA
ncbi:MAG: zinc-dependent peptidase [Myxococcota bacterium]